MYSLLFLLGCWNGPPAMVGTLQYCFLQGTGAIKVRRLQLDSNPGPVGYKSSALTTRPRMLPKNLNDILTNWHVQSLLVYTSSLLLTYYNQSYIKLP